MTAPGDILLPSSATPGARVQWALKARPVAILRGSTPGGRTMSPEDGAGFYSDHRRYLALARGRGDLESLAIWQITH